jgi:NAD(P)-dependent dehydrogenase (short-subunit alcohol dehydrogenase family)
MIDRERPLDGQWAVVTGGTKGIGKAIAERFVAGGANVVIAARGQEALDEATEALRGAAESDQEIVPMVADMGARDSIDELFALVDERLPHLNIFVANAGTGWVTPFLELTRKEVDDVLALNFTGAIYGCQRAAQAMVKVPQDNQAILAVSSIRALGARPGRLIYAASKAGLNMAIRVAAQELAPHGIRVNGLSPGITETPLTAANPEAFAEAVANVPMGRAGLPADLGAAAYFLCSPEAKFVTGANLVVDGGESLA